MGQAEAIMVVPWYGGLRARPRSRSSVAGVLTRILTGSGEGTDGDRGAQMATAAPRSTCKYSGTHLFVFIVLSEHRHGTGHWGLSTEH